MLATQGLIQVVSGGGFAAGFVSGVAGHYSGEITRGWSGTDMGDIVGRTVVASTLGGVASAATGGDFLQGAMIAATVHLFNHEAGRLAQKENQYVFGNQEHSDERVIPFIQDSLNTAEGDTFAAWSDLYDRRFSGENPDPTNVNLAAAEHYMFARDITKTKWWGGLSMAGAVPAKTVWKFMRPIFGIENQSRPSWFDVKWGNQGANDGTFDRGFPDLLGQQCSACQYQGQ